MSGTETLVREQTDQKAVLLARVTKGNQALFDAWIRAKQVADNPVEWARYMDAIGEKFILLDNLCRALKILGYTECLYKEHRPCFSAEWFCFVCPKSTSAQLKMEVQP